ncbi:MAG TPA: anti-sigma factor [Bacillales bacterium]
MAEKICDNMISYLAGELSEEETAQFQDHLQECPACRKELKELQETWQTLGYDIDETQAPADLKAEVMNYVFAEEPIPPQQSRLAIWFAALKNSFTPVTAIVTTILLIGWIGLLWNNFQLREAAVVHENIGAKAPIRITESFILQSDNPSVEAKGIVYEIQEGNEKRLVMVFQHMPETEGNSVYQAWLLYEGNRQNCGTFHVTDNGRAVLTYRLPPQAHFEDIEITLAADPNHKSPHDQRILATS